MLTKLPKYIFAFQLDTSVKIIFLKEEERARYDLRRLNFKGFPLQREISFLFDLKHFAAVNGQETDLFIAKN